MSTETWPSMQRFPTLLTPLLASQLSAALLATMLAQGQPHKGLGMGTAPGAGALGVNSPIPFRGLQPPSRPSPAPSSLPVGGQPLHPCAGLRGSASELLGCSGDQVEVSSALVFSQGTPLHLSPYLQASWESSCRGGSGPGGHFSPLQWCNGGGVLSFVPRVLRENFCGAQGFRRVETSAGSLPPPWIFTKVTRELCLHARARGIHLRVYLDDCLVPASSPELCSRHSQQVLHLCRSLGFSLTEGKSDLRPSQ